MTTPETDVTIREFAPGDQPHFQRLNQEWIARYFVLEPKDQETLIDPQTAILDPGGRIFFAVRQDQVVGCCALIAMGGHEFEVAKMAVTESSQRAGVGRRLLTEVVAQARAAGSKRLYLETNRKLSGALQLYQSFGFRPVPPERIVVSPYARADVYLELYL